VTEYASLSVSVDSRDLEKATRGLDDLEKSALTTERSLSDFGITARRVFLATAASAAALTAGIIRSTSEQQAAFAQLQRGIELSGGRAGRTIEQLQAQAAQLQRVTLFGDDQIIEAQARLLSFQNITGDVFDRAIKATLDLSQRMGTDLNSSLLQVAKALQEPVTGITALTRSGTTFTDQQKEMVKQLVESGRTLEAQNFILDELEKQYEGSARAARETFGGALTGMKNALGDLLEAGNGESLEDARRAIERLTDTISSPEFVAGAAAVANGVISFTASLANMIATIPTAVEFLNELENAFIWGRESDSVAGIQIRIDRLNAQLATLRSAGRIFADFTDGAAIAGIEAEIASLEERQRSLIDAQTEQIIKSRQSTDAAKEHAAVSPQ